MTEDEKDEVIEAARLLMAEALTLEQTAGPLATIAALMSCAATIASESKIPARVFSELALRTIEATYPEAVEAAEDWRP